MKSHPLVAMTEQGLSRHAMRKRQKERSVEIRKVKRAAKARARAIGSVWDE